MYSLQSLDISDSFTASSLLVLIARFRGPVDQPSAHHDKRGRRRCRPTSIFVMCALGGHCGRRRVEGGVGGEGRLFVVEVGPASGLKEPTKRIKRGQLLLASAIMCAYCLSVCVSALECPCHCVCLRVLRVPSIAGNSKECKLTLSELT